MKSHQSFGRYDPKKHIKVTNNDPDIIDFKNALSVKFEHFKQLALEKYHKIRMEYLTQMEYRIKENERENASEIDFIAQQVEDATHEKEEAIKRSTESRIIFANVMQTKFHSKRVIFKAWKYFYEWKKYIVAKSKFCDNYNRNKALQKVFNAWRRIAHDQFLEKALRIRDEYEVQKRTKIYQIDNKIDNLMLYLAQLQSKIAEETGLILEIPEEYQVSIETGLNRIKSKNIIF